MTFTLRGQGRFRDLVVTRANQPTLPDGTPVGLPMHIELAVIPYEDWSTGLWALLCEELERQSAKQERNTAGVTGARKK